MVQLYKRLLSYVPEKRHYAYISIGFAGVSAIVLMGAYWFLYQFFYALFVTKSYTAALHQSLIFIGLLLGYGVLYFAALLITHAMAFRLETNLRKAGLQKLMKASFAFFDTHPSGQVRKIIDDNASQTHKLVAHLIVDMVMVVVTPVMMFVVIFSVDWRLGLLLLGEVIVGAWLYTLMGGGGEFMTAYTDSLERMSSESVEYVRGMPVLKIFGISVQSYKSLLEAITSYAQSVYAYSRSCKKPYVTFQTIFNVVYLLSLPAGLYAILHGQGMGIILAKVCFFACFAGLAFSCFMRVMFAGQSHFNAEQVVNRLENLMDEMGQHQIVHGEDTVFLSDDIIFDHVSFKYEDTYILKDLSLQLQAGKTYALVGPSGSGKSTIAKLISGFYSLDEGRILIGGKDISQYSQEALFQHISFVFQQSKLFAKTIFENVQMGNPHASDEEIMEALRLAQCEEILAKFADREQTLIGSQGVHLSGGEVQRIAIARALIKGAPILIMDEASAAADPENEHELQKAFSQLMKGKTTIMIAHRLSSITHVDEILYIEAGKVVERGNHQELMSLNGRYKALQDTYAQANEWKVIG